MSVTEYGLLALVIVVPLVIAGGVTIWSLDQVRHRPKRSRGPRSPGTAPDGPITAEREHPPPAAG